ncbi:MAG: hypothetical protein GTN62_14330 [Gemmatimonadales bacterium]|nr:hypothetical protein [Gemmatimonadales bacterium]NIN13249.1 hypothetical protein [Gemmatimonadales bacterium]NIN51266.1 hypothetical protein [Gemmatimonadales bacterium]NIP08730.1 hypothetical protein [Gemmatimonadales bacterium]NIR00983.1 hypothetical protein [Gemmatimonadales bacterium]
MANRRDQDPGGGLRRFLADLRSGSDRRSGQERRQGDRRVSNLQVPAERRSGHDRRSGIDRRARAERRRRLAAQFSMKEGQLIREMVLHAERDAACPSCDGNLLLGPLESYHGVGMREVHCTWCRRNILLVDLPERG